MGANIRQRGHTWGIGAMLAAAACTPVSLPDPIIDSILPTFIVSNQPSTVQVSGQNFYGTYDVSVRGGFVTVDDRFSGSLADPLGAVNHPVVVTRRSTEQLTVQVDGRVPVVTADPYTLTVMSPSGQTANVPLQVLEKPPRTLILATSPGRVNIVGQWNPLRVLALDAEGSPVPLTTPVCLFDNSVRDPGLYVPVEIGQEGTGRACPAALTDGTPTVQVDISPQDEFAEFRGTAAGLARIGAFVPGVVPRLESTTGDASSSDVLVIQSGVPETVRLEPFDETVGDVKTTVVVLDDVGQEVPNPVEVHLMQLACADTQPPKVLGVLDDVVVSGRRAVLWPSVIRPCASARLSVWLAPESDVVVQSGRVVAGSRTQLSVELAASAPEVLRAGDLFDLVVTSLDRFGNVDPTGDSRFANQLEVASTSSAPNGEVTITQDCAARIPNGQTAVCSVVTRAASPEETFTVSIRGLDPPIEGAVGPVVVLPGEDVGSIEVTVQDPYVAGTPAPVWVLTRDAFGNPQDPSLVLGDLTPVDDLGEASCESVDESKPGLGQRFDCTLVTARPTATFEVRVGGILGVSSAFSVLNGPLTQVTIEAPDRVTAGESVDVEIAGFDAMGNPYEDQADASLVLQDDTGTWSQPDVTLDATGKATATGSFTEAVQTWLTVSQGATTLGSIGPIVVEPATTSTFVVQPLAPWAVVDEEIVVVVEPQDVYGNRTQWSGSATLESRDTASPDRAVSVVNGVGRVRFTWTARAGLTDVLDVKQAPWAGASAPFVVVSDCTAGHPSAAMTFGGHDEAVACSEESSGTGTVTADLSGSTGGSEALLGYAVSVGGSPAVSATASSIDLTLPEGRHDLLGAAISEDGCFATTTATAWVGPDDGTPVGPIELVPRSTEIDVDADSVTIDVDGVHDCARIAASAERIRLRTTGGVLVNPTATGSGMELTLDALGDGDFQVETTGDLSEGTVEVHGWVTAGTAGGMTTLDLVGDDRPPVVVEQSPEGILLSPVDEVEIVFSEPLDSSALDVTGFALTGPGSAAIESVSVEGAGERVRLGFDVSADGSAGAWWITAKHTAVTDEEGNGLAGEWANAGADYEGAFGDVGGGADPVTCTGTTPVTGTFRPDGDDGLGNESDAVDVSLQSSSAPAWWVIEVTDHDGALVWFDRAVPDSGTDVVTWDGRGFDGLVVGNGSYTVAIAPDDGLGNRGDGCSVVVTVDNATGVAP